MKIARILPATPLDLAPFGEPAARLPVLDREISAHQAAAAEAAGFELVELPEGEPLPADTGAAFWPHAVFTAAALEALAAAAGSGPAQAGVPVGTALFDFVQPLSGQPEREPYRAPLWAGPLGGRPAAPESWEGVALAAVCDEDACEEIRVDPAGPPPHRLRVPRVSRLAAGVTHWLHLLNINQALLLTERAARGLLGDDNDAAEDVEVHPTALVRGSILRAGARVEHHASVMGCYIGEDVRVADHALLVDCVIGKGCHTLVDTHLRRVIACAGSTLSNLHSEDLLLGREIFITTGVSFFGQHPGRHVFIDGEDTRRPALGGCAGHKAVLGARALFEGGVAVPAGTVIVMRPDEGIQKLDDKGLARAHTMRGDPARDA